MKTIKIETAKVKATITRPENCRHPQIYPPIDCKAITPREPECDCRWCVFHSRFNKADEQHGCSERD